MRQRQKTSPPLHGSVALFVDVRSLALPLAFAVSLTVHRHCEAPRKHRRPLERHATLPQVGRKEALGPEEAGLLFRTHVDSQNLHGSLFSFSIPVAMTPHPLQGVWSYLAVEEDGKAAPSDQVAGMAKLVLMIGEHVPTWDGMWACIDHRRQTPPTGAEYFLACHRYVLGTSPPTYPPTEDLYVYVAASRFAAVPMLAGIDFHQIGRPAIPLSSQPSPLRIEGGNANPLHDPPLCLHSPAFPE